MSVTMVEILKKLWKTQNFGVPSLVADETEINKQTTFIQHAYRGKRLPKGILIILKITFVTK